MEEIAAVYARSLFEAALDEDKLDVVRDQLGEFTDVLAENRQLQVFFFSPYFATHEKTDGLHRLLEAPEPLFRIRRGYEALWEDHNRLLPVQVTSAVELDAETVRGIGERIEEQTGRRVELSAAVEPDILGGIVVRVGNQILDASIRNRLESLRRSVARSA